MIGAIAGDIIGSVYESPYISLKTTQFPLFSDESRPTDDTVLTIALADSLLHGTDFVALMKAYFWRYPNAGYGGAFFEWVQSADTQPYNSWGNGSAMRVSPVAWAFDTLPDVLSEAKRSAAVTHNHPEGIKGAQAIAAAIFLARTGEDKPAIRHYIETTFHYDLTTPLDYWQTHRAWDVSCMVSVPQALTVFFESSDYESTVRNAVALGGDSDTLACMAGGIAEAFYGGIPAFIRDEALLRLDEPMAQIVHEFTAQFPVPILP